MALDLTTAVGRVRFVVGDHDTADPLLDGGTTQYTALLTLCGDDEAAACRVAAGALLAQAEAQPSSITASGKSLSYSRKLWSELASGKKPYPFAPDGSGVGATAFSAGVARDDGYTAESSEYA